MSRADRLMNDPNYEGSGIDCEDGAEHHWQPVSFVFESQLLDGEGRVRIRQPDADQGRVYCVCMRCHSHTYIVTEWVGFYLPSPQREREEEAEEEAQ